MNILFLTNQLRYTDGVSAHLYYLLKQLNSYKDINVFLMCGKEDSAEKFRKVKINLIVNRFIDHDIRNIGNYTSAVYSVYRFCREKSINIIHSHNHYSASIAKRVSGFTNAVTIQTNHGIIPAEGRLKHFNADHYIAVNESIRDFIVKNKTAEFKNVSVIHNGIDFSEAELIREDLPVRIIAASRFEKSKGLDTYINAISLLPADIKESTEFIIAGEGVMEKELKETDKKLKTGISFIGNQKDLRKVLEKTSVFVFPSYSDTEGLPMTIIEAAASGNLVISSDFHGIKNILKAGEEGLIFKRNDPDDLASKIIYALKNRGISDKLTAAFYNKAKLLFSSGLMASKHLSLYRKILN